MKKSIDVVDRILSNIEEYIRYFIVGGISFLSLPLISKSIFDSIMNQGPALTILGILGFGIVWYFINRTIYFPIIERVSDNANNVFRKYLKSFDEDKKLKYYQKNDLWIIIQEKEKIGENLNKYKLWKASIDMMSGISLYFFAISVICFFKYYIPKIVDAENCILLIILFIASFLLCLKSNINLERRYFHIFKIHTDGKYEEKVKEYLEYIK